MEKITLQTGYYTPEDARELLMSTIQANINFHNIKNLRAHIHTGFPDAPTLEKLEATKKAKEELTGILKKAASRKTPIKIECDIRISVENEAVMPEVSLEAQLN